MTEKRMLISNRATRDFEELLRDFNVEYAVKAADREWIFFATAVVDAIEDGNEMGLLLPPHLANCMLEVELKCRALVGKMLVEADGDSLYRRAEGQLWEELEWGVNALHFFQHWREKLQGITKDEYGQSYIPDPGEECDVAPDEPDEGAEEPGAVAAA